MIDKNFINIVFVCDGIKNCIHGDDELNCNRSYFGQFSCNDNTTISSLLVCNFKKDCQDGSDEEFCGEFM